jgi:predicted 3-demethylubiquinone-9 3-methyltransferase (glyoxalase superfamily)
MASQVVPSQLTQLLAGSDRTGAARGMEAMLQMTKIDVAKLREVYEGVPA